MGNLVGNYIHSSWENYLDYGIDRWKDSSSVKVTEKIFDTHINHIQTLASQFKIQNLQKVQYEYNKRNTLQYEQFLKILKSDKILDADKELLLESLVQAINVAMNAGWDASLIKEIARGLDFNNKTISYKGSLSKSQPSKIALVALGNATEFRYINTIMSRSTKLIEAIKQDEFLTEETKRDYEKKIVKKIIEPLRSLSSFGERSQAERQIMSKKGQRYTGTLPKQLADFYYQELSSIKTEITGIQNINIKLQAGLAEVLGNLIENSAIPTGLYALQNSLGKPSAGSQYTSKNLDPFSGISMSIIENLNAQGIKLTESGSYTDKQGNLQTIWTFDGVGDPVQQKADANFTIQLNGTSITHGVSIKNTDLATYINQNIQNDMQNFIPIQANSKTGGSSLMLYLLGMNQNLPGIANHYLNIFSKHPDLEKGAITDLHTKALESFKIAILYSALTGRNQLRQGGYADILAIYDKGKHGVFQVKLFDMSSIINDAIRFGADQVAKYIPSNINHFLIENAREEDENLSVQQNVNVRLTKVLLDAKAKHISVYLSKQYLNQTLQTRGF